MDTNTEKYKNIIVSIIIKYLPHAKIILYGSRARKDNRQGSDIDVAIDVGTKIEDKKIAAIITEIEESPLPINFDIVDFHSVSEHMQKAITKDGVLWKK